MKSLKRIFISFTIFMLIVIVIFFNLSKANVISKRDLVFYNDQLHQVEQAISEGMTEEDIEAKYSCYIIMAKEIDDVELSELYASGALVLDLNVDGDYVGKVAWNDKQENLRSIRISFLKATILLWIAVLVCGYLLIFYMYSALLRPIEDLKNFAVDIAKGDGVLQ